MFGYIYPDKMELKIREFEMFKAYYCGLCKTLGKKHGQLSRFMLNYDTTFLALLISSLYDINLTIKRERCIVHPIKKQNVLKSNSALDYAADINYILFYNKLLDNATDDNSILSKSGAAILKRKYRKIKTKYGQKCDIIEQKLRDLTELERQKCSSIDMAAEPFSKLMEEVVAYDQLCKDKNDVKILKWIGYNIGKWVYLIDACDDIEKDSKSGSYNCILLHYKYSKGQSIEGFKEKIKDEMEFLLVHILSEISKGYELLNFKLNKGLVENIIYLGMLKKTEQVLKIRSCNKREKSI